MKALGEEKKDGMGLTASFRQRGLTLRGKCRPSRKVLRNLVLRKEAEHKGEEVTRGKSGILPSEGRIGNVATLVTGRERETWKGRRAKEVERNPNWAGTAQNFCGRSPRRGGGKGLQTYEKVPVNILLRLACVLDR